MKTLRSLLSQIQFKIVILLLLTSGCADPAGPVPPSSSSASSHGSNGAQFLEEIFNEPGIIVLQGTSIQTAIDAANPGASIYIEAGLYREAVTLNKPGVKLIGLNGVNGEKARIENSEGNNHVAITEEASDAEVINFQNGNTWEKNDAFNREGRHDSKLTVRRTQISNQTAHYQFDVRVGSRPFDVVRIHRVVREQKPFHPVRTNGAVFMLHGASLTFESIFLRPGAADPTPETSVAIYLSEQNIDVWGMDFAWTLVPSATTDFAFMKDWGVERDVDHTLAAVSIARLMRGLTGQGFDRMNLLGFSYGVGVAYAAAGRETQRHAILRNVKGIVAVDQVLKYDPADDDSRTATCNTAQASKQQFDLGVYQTNNGQVFGRFAGLAGSTPNGASPFIPGMSNFQAALFIGTSTFAQGDAPAPLWHFVGDEFINIKNPVPSGLRYSDPSRWIHLLGSLPPYQPQLTTYESRACACDEESVSMDDHLGAIKLPILYVGAGGAFGSLGEYTSSLTASSDVRNHTVSLQNVRMLDFGHGDLFLADDAPSLVWSVLHEWLVNHNQPFSM
jgi:pimeloyl-ACP methyl ester carboxylesterase